MRKVSFYLALASLLGLGVHVLLFSMTSRGAGIPGTPYESIVSASEVGHLIGAVCILSAILWGFVWTVLTLVEMSGRQR